ncbi:MAG: glutaredoxin family protein [Verrucomicrobiota bacterium]
MNVQSEKPKIIAWLKPSCGWSQGVRAVLRKYDLPYEDRDIINNPDFYQEMVEKTGQMRQPCLEINGRILADVSGEEVEAWMLQQGLVRNNERAYEAPINQPCPGEMPGASPSGIGFRR